MENIIVTELADGFLQLRPAEGYTLLNTITRLRHTEAIVKDTRPYIAVKIE